MVESLEEELYTIARLMSDDSQKDIPTLRKEIRTFYNNIHNLMKKHKDEIDKYKIREDLENIFFRIKGLEEYNDEKKLYKSVRNISSEILKLAKKYKQHQPENPKRNIKTVMFASLILLALATSIVRTNLEITSAFTLTQPSSKAFDVLF